MKVKILVHTPNIEEVIGASGRLCYSKVGVDDLLEKHSQEDNERFVKMLADMGHESPLEHCSFTFAVEGISRACSHQLVRHRIASYSQQSQRYVKLEQFEYIIPPEIEVTPKAKEIFIRAMEEDQKTYDALVDVLFDKYYKKLLIKDKGEKEARREAEKKAIEDARYVSPNACETKLVFTMNVRTLINFFEKRCCSRAQWEIRDLANEMLKQCRKVSPTIFNNCGATCKTKGVCKEGKMSCNEEFRK